MRRYILLLGVILAGMMVFITWNKLEPATWGLLAAGWIFLVASELYVFTRKQSTITLPINFHNKTLEFGEMVLEMTSLIIQLHDFLQEHDWQEDGLVRERALTTTQLFEDYLDAAKEKLRSGNIGQPRLFTELLYLFGLYIQRIHLAMATNDPIILHENSLPEDRIIYLTGLVGEYLHAPPGNEIST